MVEYIRNADSNNINSSDIATGSLWHSVTCYEGQREFNQLQSNYRIIKDAWILDSIQMVICKCGGFRAVFNKNSVLAKHLFYLFSHNSGSRLVCNTAEMITVLLPSCCTTKRLPGYLL
jgi:hypothetical protein